MNKKKTPDEPYVVQYETKETEFEYERFWDTRSYEDRAERILLKRLIGSYPASAGWLVDIGGSFGRLIGVYADRFKKLVIMDYATNEFYIAKEPAKKNDVDLQLIAANAYHLPMQGGSQEALISIRVMHHLSEPELFFSEINRVLAPGGTAIIEAANKNHLKLLLRSILRFDFTDWRADWIDVGRSGLQDDGSYQLIRNYKPSYLSSMIREAGLTVTKERSISWFRRTPLAGLPSWLIDPAEWLLQQVSSLTMMGPSNWYVVTKSGGDKSEYDSFESTIADPKTKRPASSKLLKDRRATTKGAEHIDLRHPRPRR